jgi:hypothetical protein
MPIEQHFPTPFYYNQPESEDMFYGFQEEIANAMHKLAATNSPWFCDVLKTSFKYGDNVNITDFTPKLSEWILKQATEFTKENFTITESWYNIFGPGSYMDYHCHPMQDLSGVYYYQTTGKDGLLVFKSDSTGLRNSIFNVSEIGFEPVPGKLILFPAFLEHAVMKNMTTNDRISVTFNLRRIYG